MKVKVIKLDEDHDMEVCIPPIEFFIEKLQTNVQFVFLKINHGFFDCISQVDPKPNKNNYRLVAQRLYNARLCHNDFYLGVTEAQYATVVRNLFSYFYDEKLKNTYIGVSDSNGLRIAPIRLRDEESPRFSGKQRIKIIENLCDGSFRKVFLHGGIVKHYVTLGGIHKLFKELKKDKYNVIVVGPPHTECYRRFISPFKHVAIPLTNAAASIPKIKREIVKAVDPTKNNIIFGSTGIIGFSFQDIIAKHSLSWLDIGRGLDCLCKKTPVSWNIWDFNKSLKKGRVGAGLRNRHATAKKVIDLE